MAGSEWSSDAVAERHRFAFWRDELLPALGIGAEPEEGTSDAFFAWIRHRAKGSLSHVRAEADPHRVMRRPREIARRERNGYSVYRELGKGSWFRYAGEEFVTRPGDLIVTDADAPWESRTTYGGFRLEALLLPRTMLQPHLPRHAGPLLLRLSDRSGPASIAAGLLEALLREWDELDATALDTVADAFCRLLPVAGGASHALSSEAMKTARLAQVKRHCENCLADPELSPAAVATAIGISVRSLHLLFEREETSFARFVMRRRLQECRAALADRSSQYRSVADVAFAWGFNSLPTFYRAFQREYGMAPGDFRRGAPRQ